MAGHKCLFKHQYFQVFGLLLYKYEQFSSGVVIRGGGTQLQVGENLNKITERVKGLKYIALDKYCSG